MFRPFDEYDTVGVSSSINIKDLAHVTSPMNELVVWSSDFNPNNFIASSGAIKSEFDGSIINESDCFSVLLVNHVETFTVFQWLAGFPVSILETGGGVGLGGTTSATVTTGAGLLHLFNCAAEAAQIKEITEKEIEQF